MRAPRGARIYDLWDCLWSPDARYWLISVNTEGERGMSAGPAVFELRRKKVQSNGM